eukprot:TRINITY_DN5330_c0_g1_i2.p1 TRINITY_DN5330_c0_g1~~TRINITY_DN5330_c0_g1_i2.p1  ORF type:complete len:348 (+),score=94.53 TRINITY_DN5330_c0_g1_i2:40-1083(+)
MSKRVEARVQEFIQKMNRRQVVGSFNVARATADLMRFIISNSKVANAQELIDKIKAYVRRLQQSCQPNEFAVMNISRRIMAIIREETKKKVYSTRETEGPQGPALYKLLESEDSSSYLTVPVDIHSLKGEIMASITELIDEISGLYNSISSQATEHIHANEIVMVYGKSTTVKSFLVAAAARRKFEVVVAEAAPWYTGQEMAVELARAGVSTTLISDSAVFAMMARVNKVIVGTHAVLANGGLVAQAGLHAMAIAAQANSVPFVVCTGLYKLSPVYPNNRDALCGLESPASIVPPSLNCPNVDVFNPTFDYIPPELVSLFITNAGGHNPSYIYRLLAEYYSQEDESY